MQKYNDEFFYPHLGETFEYTELGHTDTLRCIMVTDRHPCFFSSPTGGCARCSCPLTCDCTNVNGYKVQFTPVSMLTEKDDLYVILTRYYFVGRGWGEGTMANHLRTKFDGDMNKFYCDLDRKNRDKLLTYVLENYDDEPNYIEPCSED